MGKFLVFCTIAVIGSTGFRFPCLAQDAAAAKAGAKASPYSSLLGEVTAIGTDGKQLTLKPDTGAAADVALDAKTHYMKVAPGEKDLKKASDIQFSEIGVGDRVLARVRKLEDGTVSPATTVVVMTKAAIAQHQERAQSEWATRGVVGTVTLVNPATKEVTLKTQGAAGKQVSIEPSDRVNVRRYAPNSVKFSDATPSTVSDIKVGDTIRVLGTKNDDGTRVTPEEIVYGTIIRQAGTILAIDTATNTVKMTDLATKKPVTVTVNEATTLKRLPPMMAAILAGGARGPGAGGPGASGSGAGGAGGGPGGRSAENSALNGGANSSARAQNGGNPGGAPSGEGAREGGSRMGQAGPGGMGGRSMDPAKMMERMPTITLADLKAGDAIIVSSSGGANPTAISLVAGVEALLTAPVKPGQAASGPNTSWNFELSVPQ